MTRQKNPSQLLLSKAICERIMGITFRLLGLTKKKIYLGQKLHRDSLLTRRYFFVQNYWTRSSSENIWALIYSVYIFRFAKTKHSHFNLPLLRKIMCVVER